MNEGPETGITTEHPWQIRSLRKFRAQRLRFVGFVTKTTFWRCRRRSRAVSRREPTARGLQFERVMPRRPCPACDEPMSDAWVLLSRRAARGEIVATRICPRCTLVCTGRPDHRPEAGYRARLCAPMVLGCEEHDDGMFSPPGSLGLARIDDARTADLERALSMTSAHRRSPRVLHVGTRDGRWLALVKRRFHVNAVALEPWRPWADAAGERGLKVQRACVEGWRTRTQFDIVVEHDLLPLLSDPAGHLRHLAARLAPGGVLLVEVPNFLRAPGITSEYALALDRPNWFTPRALVALCRRAGLVVTALVADERLRVFCHAAAPSACVPPGPSAEDVAEATWGNDLRLQLKRALAKVGATPAAVAAAAEIHGRCSLPAIRADLAIEIANACERGGDFESAAMWIASSLRDRPDPDVEQVLARLGAVRRRIAEVWAATPAANDAGPTAALAS